MNDPLHRTATSPLPELSSPDEGVSHWLGQLLQSTTLEQGMSLLLAWIEESITHGSLALWVWPEPRIEARGLVGLSRYFETRHEILGDRGPTDDDLARWSFPAASRDQMAVTRLSEGAVLWERDARAPLLSHEILWLNTLTGWLALRETALRDAKLASLAEFAAGAGHEINNPLATILGRSQLLLRNETNPERRRSLGAIGGQALRIRDMISDMMVVARPPAPRLRPVSIVPLIEQTLLRFEEELRTAQIRIEQKLSAPDVAHVDPEQFQVVLIEQIRNAIRAAGRGGRIGLRVRTRIWKNAEWLELDLYNNGPELTPLEQVHAFDPFFSGRNAGRGLGFGLTKCWRIMNGHGGRIGVHSTSLQTVFRTLWPLSTTPSESPAFGAAVNETHRR